MQGREPTYTAYLKFYHAIIANKKQARTYYMGLLSFNTTTKAVGAFQQMNLWELSLKFPRLNIPDNVLFRCVSASIPESEGENITATVNRFELTQPSHIKRAGSIDLEFLESDKAETTILADEIDKLVFSMDDKDAKGLSVGWEDIQGTALLYLLNSKGAKTQGYKLVSCWMKPSFAGDLSNDTEARKLKIILYYNWWYFIKV